jgi:hypothetical protein
MNGALRLKPAITYSGEGAGSYYYGAWGDAGLERQRLRRSPDPSAGDADRVPDRLRLLQHTQHAVGDVGA